MLQLVNLSNYTIDNELIHNNSNCLQAFLNYHHLDGIEMMFCTLWDSHVHKKDFIKGVHLKFWPSWYDFWRGNKVELLQQFGSDEKIAAYYGGLTRDEWLDVYRTNIRTAQQANAAYLVFHVSHARTSEIFNWQFSVSDEAVIEATIEVINELADDIPDHMALLFENLWWPGLTLKKRDLTALLLNKVKHKNIGIMLDTGHLMNTNPRLKTEAESVEYILETLSGLGDCRKFIRGIHLHKSLSGKYVLESKLKSKQDYTMTDIMDHVLKIDEHLPFTTPEVRRIIDYIQPEYLVHEFMQTSVDDWAHKVTLQQQALGVWRKKP